MQTCATCHYFVLREDDQEFGDCRRFPPQTIVAGYDVMELEATDKVPVITMPSGVPARPLSMWLIKPNHAAAFGGVNITLWCGEWAAEK
jgi:hypothetical protein